MNNQELNFKVCSFYHRLSKSCIVTRTKYVVHNFKISRSNSKLHFGLKFTNRKFVKYPYYSILNFGQNIRILKCVCWLNITNEMTEFLLTMFLSLELFSTLSNFGSININSIIPAPEMEGGEGGGIKILEYFFVGGGGWGAEIVKFCQKLLSPWIIYLPHFSGNPKL